jgi:LacI family transcriptional regulator
VVTLDTDIWADRAGQVVSDHEAVGRVAFEHFRRRGYSSFAWCSRLDSDEIRRAHAFERVVGEAGLECARIGFFEVPDGEQQPSRFRQQWLRDRIAELPVPTAILAVNDWEAVDVLDACEDAGRSVPDQIAVMGVGNSREVCGYAPVPLSSVDTAREDCGYEAAALLGRMMDGQPRPAQPVVVPIRGVTTRLSTDVVAVAHQEVARAVRFIWQKAHEGITVSDVAAEVALSRRALFAAFRKHLGRSPHQEILTQRLKVAKRLLLDTELKVYQVAKSSGFGTLTNFYQVFDREVGVPPRVYREGRRQPNGQAMSTANGAT